MPALERILEDEVDGYRGSALRKKDSFRDYNVHVRAPSPSPSPPPMPANKKLYQRTRFAADIPPPSSRLSHGHGSPSPTGNGHGGHGGHGPSHSPTTVVKTQQQSASQIIGDSFRKLVGKFRSGSSDRNGKSKASRKLSNKSSNRGSSRSPSPTYRQAEGSLLGLRSKKSKSSGGRRSAHSTHDADGSSPDAGTEEGDSPEEVPVAPPRHGHAGSRSVKRSQSRSQPRDYDTVDGELRTTRKYYLGEDPFGGSIYGREREYDGVVPARRKQRETRRGSQSEEERNSSLGRLSKSTSRLTSSGAATQHNTMLNGGHGGLGAGRRPEYYSGRGGSQTLPRKLRDRDDSAARTKKQVYVTKSNVERSSPTSPQVWEHRFSRSSPRSSPLTSSPHTGSLINVSFVKSNGVNNGSANGSANGNGVTWDRLNAEPSGYAGPAKPARTYRTSLTRSKSFNVQAGPTTYVTPAKSSSQLHRLEESPPPLKSPSILASISRSTRDLTDAVDKENNVEDLYTKPQRRQGPNRLFSSTSHLNGVNSQQHGQQDPKKKAFMRGLLDRAPELFKTLHPDEEPRSQTPVRVIDYSNSFRSSNTATPPPRSPYRASPASPSGGAPYRRDSSGSQDYSETVRITSKCNDPLRPSVTSTVQSFSKRRDGRDLVETSDTSTVTKSSRYRGGSGDSGVETSSSSSPHSRFILDASKYPRHSARHADKHALNGGVVIEVRNTRK